MAKEELEKARKALEKMPRHGWLPVPLKIALCKSHLDGEITSAELNSLGEHFVTIEDPKDAQDMLKSATEQLQTTNARVVFLNLHREAEKLALQVKAIKNAPANDRLFVETVDRDSRQKLEILPLDLLNELKAGFAEKKLDKLELENARYATNFFITLARVIPSPSTAAKIPPTWRNAVTAIANKTMEIPEVEGKARYLHRALTYIAYCEKDLPFWHRPLTPQDAVHIENFAKAQTARLGTRHISPTTLSELLYVKGIKPRDKYGRTIKLNGRMTLKHADIFKREIERRLDPIHFKVRVAQTTLEPKAKRNIEVTALSSEGDDFLSEIKTPIYRRRVALTFKKITRPLWPRAKRAEFN
ncbi:MAG: hypothetical protein V1722_00380 [Candidatus Micrarchaeota archaeon]